MSLKTTFGGARTSNTSSNAGKFLASGSYLILLSELTEFSQPRERSITKSNAVEDARASLDEGNDCKEGQHGEFPKASMGLGQCAFYPRASGEIICNPFSFS